MIDAFPGFTKFDKAKKVQFVLQVIDSVNTSGHNYFDTTVHRHDANKPWDTSMISPTESIYKGETIIDGSGVTFLIWATPIVDGRFSPDIGVYKSAFLSYLV